MCAATLAVIKRETKSTKKYAYDYRLFVPDGLFCRIRGLSNFFKDPIVMTQYIIVGLIMLACVFFLLRKFVFKPKKTRLQQRLRQMRRLRLNKEG